MSATRPPRRYFVWRDGRRKGPFTARQVRQLAAQGKIRPSDELQGVGAEARYPISGVPNLLTGPAAKSVTAGDGNAEQSAGKTRPRLAPNTKRSPQKATSPVASEQEPPAAQAADPPQPSRLRRARGLVVAASGAGVVLVASVGLVSWMIFSPDGDAGSNQASADDQIDPPPPDDYNGAASDGAGGIAPRGEGASQIPGGTPDDGSSAGSHQAAGESETNSSPGDDGNGAALDGAGGIAPRGEGASQTPGGTPDDGSSGKGDKRAPPPPPPGNPDKTLFYFASLMRAKADFKEAWTGWDEQRVFFEETIPMTAATLRSQVELVPSDSVDPDLLKYARNHIRALEENEKIVREAVRQGNRVIGRVQGELFEDTFSQNPEREGPDRMMQGRADLNRIFEASAAKRTQVLSPVARQFTALASKLGNRYGEDRIAELQASPPTRKELLAELVKQVTTAQTANYLNELAKIHVDYLSGWPLLRSKAAARDIQERNEEKAQRIKDLPFTGVDLDVVMFVQRQIIQADTDRAEIESMGGAEKTYLRDNSGLEMSTLALFGRGGITIKFSPMPLHETRRMHEWRALLTAATERHGGESGSLATFTAAPSTYSPIVAYSELYGDGSLLDFDWAGTLEGRGLSEVIAQIRALGEDEWWTVEGEEWNATFKRFGKASVALDRVGDGDGELRINHRGLKSADVFLRLSLPAITGIRDPPKNWQGSDQFDYPLIVLNRKHKDRRKQGTAAVPYGYLHAVEQRKIADVLRRVTLSQVE